MSYVIAEKEYKTKKSVTEKCRAILTGTANGSFVTFEDRNFLIGLFSHHDEWEDKSISGVAEITTMDTLHGTRCFCLVREDGSRMDISFMHAIKRLSGPRTREKIPQKLVDFKNAARAEIFDQIRAFRDANGGYIGCNMHVDHKPPKTFDSLLFTFCRENKVNPLNTVVIEREGCLHMFQDRNVAKKWVDYHLFNAELRIISPEENLSLPKESVPWDDALRDCLFDHSCSDYEVDVYTDICCGCGFPYQMDDCSTIDSAIKFHICPSCERKLNIGADKYKPTVMDCGNLSSARRLPWQVSA